MVLFVKKRQERDICEKYENCMLSENVHDRSFRLDKKFSLQLETNPRFQNIGGRLTVHMIARLISISEINLGQTWWYSSTFDDPQEHLVLGFLSH